MIKTLAGKTLMTLVSNLKANEINFSLEKHEGVPLDNNRWLSKNTSAVFISPVKL